MPAQRITYAPDFLDCSSQITALHEDFGVIVDISLKIERDNVVIYASTRKPAMVDKEPPICVALAKRPLKSRPVVEVMMFAVLQDLWIQHDRGSLAVRPERVAHGWSGRPEVRRRADK